MPAARSQSPRQKSRDEQLQRPKVTVQEWSPSPEQLATLTLVAAMNKAGMKIGAVAVIAGVDVDMSRLMTPEMTGAIWTVERGCLGEFLRDPALSSYLRHRVPVIVCLEDADDPGRFQAAFGLQATTDA